MARCAAVVGEQSVGGSALEGVAKPGALGDAPAPARLQADAPEVAAASQVASPARRRRRPALSVQRQHWLRGAVTRFIDVATGVSPSFQVTNDTAPLIAELCARVGGLALGIELVAARTATHSMEGLVAEIGARLESHLGWARLPNQEVLSAVIAWSYQQLTGEEQALLRRLGLFVGGCPLALVGDLCQGSRASLDALHAARLAHFELLNRLLDAEEVTRPPAASRSVVVRLPEAIRQFALAELEAHGEADPLRQAVESFQATAPPDLRAALVVALPVAETSTSATAGARSGPDLLTDRERQVAALVAAGMSNRQIAEALVITERTAANHVQHVLQKIDLHSRVHLAAWAVHHGLTVDTVQEEPPPAPDGEERSDAGTPRDPDSLA